MHDSRKALPYADSMLAIAKLSITNHQYLTNYAEANFAFGDAYFDLSEYSDAYKHFYQGYFVGKSAINKAVLSEYTYRMGMVMFKQAHYLGSASILRSVMSRAKVTRMNSRLFTCARNCLTTLARTIKTPVT